MTALLPIVILGVVIVILAGRLLFQAASRKEKPGVALDEYAQARQALDSAFIETAMIQRIFSGEDAQFIRRSATPAVQQSFRRERKQLALHWFQKTRRQVAELMDLHLRLASYTYDPDPGFELRLTARYLAFMAVSRMILLLLWIFGPFNATRITSYAIRMAGGFCSTFSLRLSRVNPARLSPE